MSYVVINFKNNSTISFDDKDRAIEYVLADFGRTTARMLTHANVSEEEVADYLNSIVINEKQENNRVLSLSTTKHNYVVYAVISSIR